MTKPCRVQKSCRPKPGGRGVTMFVAWVLVELALNGVNLTRGFAFSKERERGGFRPAGIHFSELADAQRSRLIAAGEPVWWKVDPQPFPAKGFAEAVIRRRRNPRAAAVAVQVGTGTTRAEARVDTGQPHPRIAGVAFSPALDEVTLYLRRPQQEGSLPVRCRYPAETGRQSPNLMPWASGSSVP